jgi:hypothetical protein
MRLHVVRGCLHQPTSVYITTQTLLFIHCCSLQPHGWGQTAPNRGGSQEGHAHSHRPHPFSTSSSSSSRGNLHPHQRSKVGRKEGSSHQGPAYTVSFPYNGSVVYLWGLAKQGIRCPRAGKDGGLKRVICTWMGCPYLCMVPTGPVASEDSGRAGEL